MRTGRRARERDLDEVPDLVTADYCCYFNFFIVLSSYWGVRLGL